MFLRRVGVEAKGTVPGGGPNARFPGYDVLGTVDTWDAVTAGVVLSRLGPPPPIRFFTAAEQALGAALFDQLLDQRSEPKVPVLQMVDARLAESITDGWHYEDMPEDGEAFRRSFAALDDDARAAYHDKPFHAVGDEEQQVLIQRVQDASSNTERWHDLSAKHVWSLWTRYACAAFYSHPWAWNEIGFGGPAYPRGYKHMGIETLEPWEVEDHLSQDDPVPWAERVEAARKR